MARLGLVLTTLIALAFSAFVNSEARSEDAPTPADQIAIGPIPITHDVQGVPVTVNVTSYFWLATRPDGVYLKANVESDLHELQAKFSSIVDTFPLPRDNCASYTLLNPVVSVPSKSLTSDQDAATVRLSGQVDGWTCLQNPVPQTYWDSTGCRGRWPWGGEYSFGCPKTRPGSPIKNLSVQQPFDTILPVYLRQVNNSGVAIVLGDPNVRLGGQFVGITNAILKIANVDISAEAKKALDKAVDPSKLTFLVPKEYQDLNPVVADAQFFTNEGRLTARVRLEAKIPVERLTEFVKSMVGGLKQKPQ